MIRLQAVSKSFAQRPVLSGISLELKPGELMLISGQTGRGKSTLCNIIAGLTKPDAGSVFVATTQIGYAFQDLRLVDWLSVRRNLLFALAGRPDLDQNECARDALEQFDLEGSAEQTPPELSGGMKQRLALARAFVVRPRLLILDEPFAFQDDGHARAVADLILAAHSRGTTIVLVNHEERAEELLGDRRPVKLFLE